MKYIFCKLKLSILKVKMPVELISESHILLTYNNNIN